jgi:hypothetical protein
MKHKSDANAGTQTSCPAPWYVIDRFSAGSISSDAQKSIGTSSDFRKIEVPSLWSSAFLSEVDWKGGWRDYWNCASDEHGTGSEFSYDRIGIEIQTFFKDSTQWSRGVAVPNNGIDEEVAQYINGQILNACGSDTPETGAVGIMVENKDEFARPMLTIVTSGPGGGVESAQIIQQALNDVLPLFAVAVRSIRDDQSGIVKIIFMPEIYSLYECQSFGIDWSKWKNTYAQNPELEWGTSCLIWCDNLAAAALEVQEQARLMVDEVYFDFCRAVDLKRIFIRDNNINPCHKALLEGLERSPITLA